MGTARGAPASGRPSVWCDPAYGWPRSASAARYSGSRSTASRVRVGEAQEVSFQVGDAVRAVRVPDEHSLTVLRGPVERPRQLLAAREIGVARAAQLWATAR